MSFVQLNEPLCSVMYPLVQGKNCFVKTMKHKKKTVTLRHKLEVKLDHCDS